MNNHGDYRLLQKASKKYLAISYRESVQSPAMTQMIRVKIKPEAVNIPLRASYFFRRTYHELRSLPSQYTAHQSVPLHEFPR